MRGKNSPPFGKNAKVAGSPGHCLACLLFCWTYSALALFRVIMQRSAVRIPGQMLSMFLAQMKEAGEQGQKPSPEPMPHPSAPDRGAGTVAAPDNGTVGVMQQTISLAQRRMCLDFGAAYASCCQFRFDDGDGSAFDIPAVDGDSIEQILGRGFPSVLTKSVKVHRRSTSRSDHDPSGGTPPLTPTHLDSPPATR